MENHNPLQPLMPSSSAQYFPNCLPSIPPEGFPGMGYPPPDVAMQYGSPYGMPAEPEQDPALPQWPSHLPLQAPPKTTTYPAEAAMDTKLKPRRRSKNDSSGRDYCCGCGKTYLSYPALYTHVKMKHGGVNPAGTTLLNGGRGRGRPRKV